jgi:hypothetical protein
VTTTGAELVALSSSLAVPALIIGAGIVTSAISVPQSSTGIAHFLGGQKKIEAGLFRCRQKFAVFEFVPALLKSSACPSIKGRIGTGTAWSKEPAS